MDAETGKLNWLKKPLFVLYICVIIAFVFKFNPYLYSPSPLINKFNDSLINTPKVFPTNLNLDELSNVKNAYTVVPDFNNKRSNSIEEDQIFHRQFDKKETFEVKLPEILKNTKINWTWDSNSFLITNSTNQITCFGFNGELIWKTTINENEFINNSVISTESNIFVSTNKGRIISLEKKSGWPTWSIQTSQSVIGPMFLNNNLIYFYQMELQDNNDKKYQLMTLNLKNLSVQKVGIENFSQPADTSPIFDEQSGHAYYSFLNGDLKAIHLSSGKTSFTYKSESGSPPHAMLALDKIILSDSTQKIVALDSKTGIQVWESLLEGPVSTRPTLVPYYDYISVLTDDGYLQSIDAKTGERKWKFLTHNSSPLKQTISLRLHGKWIEKFEMKWKYKGFVILSPCGDQRICMYNPDKGQIVGRIYLDGSISKNPLIINDQLFAPIINKDQIFIQQLIETNPT